MDTTTDTPRRGRGRPPKLPAGTRKTVRCVLTEGELAEVDVARRATGQSQLEFSRAAVLRLAREVNGGRPT